MSNKKQSEKRLCAVCQSEGALRCGACKEVNYCSKEHQQSDWNQHKIKCRPFEIRSSKELGRYLECKRDLDVGSTIVSERPIIYGPKIEGPEPQCLGCYQPIDPLLADKCPRCKWPVCSQSCIGIIHPAHHMPECIFLAVNTAPAEEHLHPYEAITPLRCLLLQKRNPKKWKQLISLESHINKRGKGSSVYDSVERIVQYLQDNFLSKLDSNALPDMSAEVIRVICGIIEVNAIEITTGKGEICALYAAACLMEHSCIPNTKYNFNLEDFKIEVAASVDIKKGEHICTMYTHLLWGTQARREHLKNTKYFFCTCKRCLDPTELGTNMSAVKCIGVVLDDISSRCPGYMLPTNLKETDSDWKCKLCPAVLTTTHITDLISRINVEVDTAMENPTIYKLLQLLSKLEKLLHPNHYQCFMVKHSLIQLYGREPGYSVEKLKASDLNLKIDMSRDLLNQLAILDPGNSRVSLYSGVVLLELHNGLFELHKRSEDPLTKEKYLSEAKAHLEKCVDIMRHEPPFSAGSTMLNIAKGHLVSVNSELKKYKIIQL